MKAMRKNLGAIVIGLIVILVGVSYAAKAMGYDFDLSTLLFRGWWTVFIIVPGVLKLFDKDFNKVSAIILIAVGVGLLVSQLLHLSLWSWIAPVAIIAVGVSIVTGAFRNKDDESGNDAE